jgi:glycosyltransferase involved in cell wall biosynthesis
MRSECHRVIILHDYFEWAEGGGRLSSILADSLHADLGFGFKIARHPFFENPSSIQKEISIISPTAIPLWRQYKLARGFQQKTGFLHSYHTVIYSGFYTPLAIGHHRCGRNIHYCHTPPRFLYDQRDFYFALIPTWQHPFLEAFNRYFQPRYERAVSRMDVVIANSINVQQRIKKYLGCDATVVHPPCDLERFRWEETGDFYLSTARLDPLKRVDLVVKAFKKMNDRKLVVVSGGPEFQPIRRIAAGTDNIEVLGWVDEQSLQSLLSTCLATIYIPKDEDFGMSPVESMAAGKPVIGVAEGGLLETVVDGETGSLIPADEVTVESLCQAVNSLSRRRAVEMREACEKRARLFSREIFIEKMKQIM